LGRKKYGQDKKKRFNFKIFGARGGPNGQENLIGEVKKVGWVRNIGRKRRLKFWN
jgi:hypothetical protein